MALLAAASDIDAAETSVASGPASAARSGSAGSEGSPGCIGTFPYLSRARDDESSCLLYTHLSLDPDVAAGRADFQRVGAGVHHEGFRGLVVVRERIRRREAEGDALLRAGCERDAREATQLLDRHRPRGRGRVDVELHH